MADPFAAQVQQATSVLTLNDAYHDAKAITASDTTTFDATRAVYVKTSGSLVVDFAYPSEGGISITLGSCSAGFIYPFRVTRVYAASSASVGLVGLY
jgi:hypothetical protein